ncbi:MAG TPA: TlyA family RNA methyltransferase [Candidatus Acidoferrum sp.]|nr:TlyA family RNA methyltransferase [Candidatus Acidoferrum sp.]
MSKNVRLQRLDALIVERGLAGSLAKAQAMILAGEVSVDGRRADKSGARFLPQSSIEITTRSGKFVSRGGLKLEGALEDFAIDPHALACIDIGASTGGFTDCLLQRGAARVYAVDVNLDQLAWKLRQDHRVIRISRNARQLRSTDIPEPADLLVFDVSFISVSKVLPAALAVAKHSADFLILVKPQFELPREDVGPGGIVSRPALHQKAIAAVRETAVRLGLHILAVAPSRLPGAEGNLEYFLHARKTLR